MGLTDSSIAMEVRSFWETALTPMALRFTSIPALVCSEDEDRCVLGVRLTKSRQ